MLENIFSQAGVSRSASIVISFLMKKLNIKFEEAFLFLKVKRPHIQPNEGFVSELKAYEAALFSEQEISLLKILIKTKSLFSN